MISNVARINTANGDGANDTFTYTFRVLEETDLVVLVSTAGVWALKVLNTDYTVTGVNDDAGGTVVFGAGDIPPAGTANVAIFGSTELSQLTQLVEGGVGYINLEQSLDRLTMIVQELSARFGAAVLNDTDVVRWNAIARALVSAVAFDLDYTPTTSSDWDVVPDNVGDALDELAQRLRAGSL